MSMASNFGPILSAVGVAGIYCLSLWRVIKGNRENRVVECGSIALIVFALLAALVKIPNLPDWVLPSVGLLLLLLCLLTMFFLFLQVVHAITNRKTETVKRKKINWRYVLLMGATILGVAAIKYLTWLAMH